jgi:hypothetical protein
MTSEDARNDFQERYVEYHMRNWHSERWKPFIEELGLTNEDMVDRLVRLLVMHLLLDRTLTAVLTLTMTDGVSSTFGDVEPAVAKLEMAKRIGLAKASKIVSDSCADDIYAVNDARNNVAHYQAKTGWKLDTVKELLSAEEFEACAKRGMRALKEITAITGNKLNAS